MNRPPPLVPDPERRASAGQVHADFQTITRHQTVCELMDSLPSYVLLLNSDLQIVFANQSFCQAFGFQTVEDALRLRPGEAVGCVHAGENCHGCGATEFCRYCGARQSIHEAMSGVPGNADCQIETAHGKNLDLRVHGKPFAIDGQTFTLFVAEDVQHEKRRHFLERSFLHDILNYASGLQGVIRMIPESSPEEREELSVTLCESADRLMEAILAHRDMVNAESGDLATFLEPIATHDFLQQVVESYRHHRLAKDRQLRLAFHGPNETIVTDARILERVLGNLLINACEASAPGDVITLSCVNQSGLAIYKVANPQYIPRPVQLQIFKRSFSTKGTGRGLGTYSVKLYTEKYLGGMVTFASEAQQGTTFSIVLPPDAGQPLAFKGARPSHG